MSKQYKRLLATVDAAGYALAAPEDVTPTPAADRFEAEFRNGHRLAAQNRAAQKVSDLASRAIDRLTTPSQTEQSRALVTTAGPVQTTSWMQSLLNSVRPKGFAA